MINSDILVENITTKFWEDLEAFPMHYTFLPHNIEVDFLMAMSFGANGMSRVVDEGHQVSNAMKRECLDGMIHHFRSAMTRYNDWFKYTGI